MRTSRFAAFVVVAGILTIAVALALSAAPGTKPLADRLGATPVVVELFTSQGCSSCPPADALLRTFTRDPRLRGKVIPLAFHVDYWDRLGWRDPFSSADATRRQQFYVRAMKLNGAYTPQAVVNGARELVGSNEAALASAIEAASKAPAAGTIRVTSARKGDVVEIAVRGDAPADGYDVLAVLYENDVTTNVGAGENNGRTLVNDAIVRRMIRLNVPRGAIDKKLTIAVEPAWKNLGVAALLQERATLHITAAAS